MRPARAGALPAPEEGPGALEAIEDALAGPRTRIELESTDLARSYEIFASEMQDRNQIRQLFSPSFVVWLAEEAPPGFGFELFGGKLCCHVDGHAADADTLDRVAAATVADSKAPPRGGNGECEPMTENPETPESQPRRAVREAAAEAMAVEAAAESASPPRGPTTPTTCAASISSSCSAKSRPG